MKGPPERPASIPEGEWNKLLNGNPGVAAARFLAAHEGVALETEGSNRGPLLRDWAADERAIDGQPYCATIALSLIRRFGGEVPSRPGKHWLWHGRSVLEAAKAWRNAGLLMGWRCPAPAGSIVFWERRAGSDAGRGGHMDILLEDAGENLVMVGANLSHVVKVRALNRLEARARGFLALGSLTR